MLAKRYGAEIAWEMFEELYLKRLGGCATKAGGQETKAARNDERIAAPRHKMKHL
jgi:hypothetical protein